MPVRGLGFVAILIAAFLWGTTGTTQGFLPEAREPLVVAALRLGVAGLVLMLLALSIPQTRRAFRTAFFGGIILAGLAMAANNLLFFTAVTKVGVGIGTAITIGSGPIWVIAYEIIIQRIMPRWQRLAGQALAILGVAILGLADHEGAGSFPGLIMAAGAGLCYGAYVIFTKKAADTMPPLTVAAGTFLTAGLIALPVLFVFPLGWTLQPEAILLLAWLGIGATSLPYILYTWGLKRVAASTGATLALLEPVTAWLLAMVMLGEAVTTMKIVGGLILALGLVVIALFPATARQSAVRP